MKSRLASLQQSLAAWRLAGPAAVLLILLYLLPILGLVILSITDYELGATSVSLVGINNFLKATSDLVFLRSLKNTLLYVAIVIPSSVILGLVMALLVHARHRSRGFYEVAFFLPVTATLVAMATVWQFLLHPKLGPVNTILQSLGFAPQAFISEPGLVMPTLAFIGVWQLLGFNMVLFLAGLSNIPADLYDAAAIDGADGVWDKFWVVTWPQLAPTTLFVTVTTSITAFKVFETVAALTQGRSGSEVLLYAIYLEGFQFFKMGYASALTMVFLAIILLLALIQMKVLDRKVHYV